MKNKNHLARVEWRYAVQLGNDDADIHIKCSVLSSEAIDNIIGIGHSNTIIY